MAASPELGVPVTRQPLADAPGMRWGACPVTTRHDCALPSSGQQGRAISLCGTSCARLPRGWPRTS